MKKAVGCNRACIKKAKKQPGAGFWAPGCGGRGWCFPRRRGRRRVPGERPGRRSGNGSLGSFSRSNPAFAWRWRRGPGRFFLHRGIRGAPLSRRYRGANSFFTSSKNYESSWKSFEAVAGFALLRPVAGAVGERGFAAPRGLDDPGAPEFVRLFERGFTQHTSNTNRNWLMRGLRGHPRGNRAVTPEAVFSKSDTKLRKTIGINKQVCKLFAGFVLS